MTYPAVREMLDLERAADTKARRRRQRRRDRIDVAVGLGMFAAVMAIYALLCLCAYHLWGGWAAVLAATILGWLEVAAIARLVRS